MAFLAVYIAEAHASDQWPLGDRVAIAQHATLAERAAASRRFRFCTHGRGDAAAALPPMPMAVDAMDDAFERAFACHGRAGLLRLSD